jgi:hypothetical protein
MPTDRLGQLTHLVMTRFTLKGGTVKLDESATFTVQINPADFKHTTGITYDKKKTQGDAQGTPKFAAVGDEHVSFALVLDGTGIVPPGANGKREDVRTQMKKLNAVTFQYLPDTQEPPLVRLLWGSLIFFGRLESLNTQYTLFKPSGEPLRARVDLSFLGAMSKEEARLVSNREPEASLTSVTIVDGDTLPQLCADHCGSAAAAPAVARANNLPSLMAVTPGTTLAMSAPAA